ncbi:TraR/DksA family transcriptional regulator [Stackebrandtia nassauensis]|uniref:Transcriptional regulator, TraR/DksA family n=1 Tax=Stackebrandtia nassauensis (strain DSM 44728 / CIP 108903 / NRRL B-16338 / NBRC 102104 / LLR-40K-21) TaxID=446470 RepID=D3PZW7_STANL|nr:TraR/DksA C4-type zinc finger protein [Stackebrandtia nassauensis]ADD43654.1 transcriptional regulator, TraR/DksA family [Stackebrandtia nassauensis DSM 44728]
MTSTKKKPSGDTATAEPPAKKAASTAKTAVKAKSKRSAKDTEEVRLALEERLAELRAEHAEAIVGISEMQKERLSDSAGDDQVDSGSKTVEREQEISLANSVRDRMVQVERALERLEDGDYGVCEKCGTNIPAARLAAFPSATLCVDCKSVEERR